MLNLNNIRSLQNNSRKGIDPLTRKTGVLLEDFETLTGWTVGVGSAELDAVNVKGGGKGIKLTSTNNVTAYMTKAISWDLSSMDHISIWLYVHNQANYTTTALIYLSNSSSSFSNTFSYSLPSGFFKVFQNGWNKVVLHKSLFTQTGSISWSDTMLQLRVRVASPSGQSNAVTFDKLVINEYVKPQVLITFDDGRKTDYSEAFSYMKSKGLKATSFVPMANVAADNTYMTLEDLHEMYNAGWDIGNHSYNHTDLTTLTQAQVEDELQDDIDALEAQGFYRASRMLAWPFSAVNDTAIAACNAVGILFGRTGVNYLQPTIPDLKLTMRRVSVTNTMSVADLTAKVDEAILRGVSAIYNFHRILDPASESTEVLPTTFRGFIDYLVTKRDLELVDVVSVSEFYEKITTNLS